MYCRKCGFKLGEENRFCPECGEPKDLNKANESNKTSNGNNKKAISMVVAVVVVILGVALLATISNKDDTSVSSNKSTQYRKKKKASKKKLELFDAETGTDLLYYIGTYKDDMIDDLGYDYEEDYYNGGPFIFYYDDMIAFLYDESTDVINGIMVSNKNIELNGEIIDAEEYFDQMEKKLGVTTEKGYNDHDGEYYMNCDIGKYNLYFGSPYDFGGDWNLKLQLK